MIIDRILQLIDFKQLSKRQFYIKTGLSNGFLDKNKDIGVSKLENILQSFPDVNPIWLLTGQGEMLLSNSEKIISGNGNNVQVGHNNEVRNNSDNTNTNNSYIEKISFLENEIKLLKKTIEDKEEIIQLLKKV